MYYCFNEDWKFLWYSSSEVIIGWIKWIKLDLNSNDLIKIENWCLYKDGIILETEEYIKYKTEKSKEQKKEEIEKIASISDQLNLTAGTLDIIVDLLAKDNPELLQHPWIIESKNKLNSIKEILNK